MKPIPGSRGNKMGAKRVLLDGHVFPSKAEAKRYVELKLLLRAGVIQDLVLQPRFEFPFKAHYTADFEYTDTNGVRVIEEVKGLRTEAFQLRLKCFMYFFANRIILVNGIDARLKPRAKRKKAKK